jgi:hypothetical protein
MGVSGDHLLHSQSSDLPRTSSADGCAWSVPVSSPNAERNIRLGYKDGRAFLSLQGRDTRMYLLNRFMIPQSIA